MTVDVQRIRQRAETMYGALVAPDAHDLVALADELLAAGLSQASEVTYGSSFGVFERFCNDCGASALPTDPATLVAFLSSRDRALPHNAITAYALAIAHVHLAAGYDDPRDHPLVQRKMRRLKRRHGVSTRCRPALDDEGLHEVLAQMLASQQSDAADRLFLLRDRALLTFLYATGIDRGLVSALDVDNIVFHRGGFRLEHERLGQLEVSRGRTLWGCPVRALQAYLTALGLKSGPLFRSYSARHGWSRRLQEQDITMIVKSRAAQAGYEGITPYSLRCGSAISAARAGAEMVLIAARLGIGLEDVERCLSHPIAKKGAPTTPSPSRGVRSASISAARTRRREADERRYGVCLTPIRWEALRAISARPGDTHDLARRISRSYFFSRTIIRELGKAGLVEWLGGSPFPQITPRGRDCLVKRSSLEARPANETVDTTPRRRK